MDRINKPGAFRIFIILYIGFIFIPPAIAEPIANTNTMANLFSVLNQAVQQQYTDSNYYYSQLAKMNAINNALSDELKNLNNSGIQAVVYEANRRGVGIYVNYLIQSKPHNLFYFADGTKLSFTNIQAINSAIQRGNFASIQSMTACPTGQTKCGTMCVNLKTDFGNCGYCGRGCAKGQICSDWKCMQPVIKMPIRQGTAPGFSSPINWRTDYQQVYNHIWELYKYGRNRAQLTEIEAELKSSEKTMIAAEQLLSTKPINKQIAESLVMKINTHTRNLNNLTSTFGSKSSNAKTQSSQYDQKVNQLFNILSTVLKNEIEMKESISRNIN